MAYGAVTVTTAATLIVPANAERLSLLVQNLSSETLYIAQDNLLTSITGWALLQNANLTEDSGGTKVYTGPIYGITGASTANVRWWERTRA